MEVKRPKKPYQPVINQRQSDKYKEQKKKEYEGYKTGDIHQAVQAGDKVQEYRQHEQKQRKDDSKRYNPDYWK